jgi:hypothetical protein
MYAKLFTSIYQGTLRGNSHGLLVFTNLLAHCDKEGRVDMHPRAIAEEVGLSVDQVKAALRELEAPDAESRSPEEEGRRIVRMDEHRDWGWVVVNYLKYRTIRDEDDRREQNRLSQERWRNKNKPASASVIIDKQRKPPSANTEAEVDTDTKKVKRLSTGVANANPVGVWAAYSDAYQRRYGAEPVRNAKVNAQLAQFVGRVGAPEAPSIAQFYVSHQGQFYVRAMHTTDLLLRDAEKLRTEWATGRGVAEPVRETDYARSMREKIEQISPQLAAKRPGSKPEPITIDMEPSHGTARIA